MIYELKFQIDSKPFIRRGSLVELQLQISDALHHNLEHLELTRTNELESWEKELLEAGGGQIDLEVKQAPINTANHKCMFCGKSIKEVSNLGNTWWIHQHSLLTYCWDGSSNTATPKGQ